MRLTTRGRYAVTALLDLALQDQQTHLAVSLSDIAKRQDISISYLEQLFSKLRKQGLVISTRGASGGYHIAKPLDQISVMSIIAAVDESVDARACEGKGNCQDGAMCLTHTLWSGLSEHIEQYLSQVTLAELINQRDIRTIAERQIMMIEQPESDFTDKSEPMQGSESVATSRSHPQSTKARHQEITKITTPLNSGENLPA